MKKLLIFALLSIGALTVSSCYSDDNGYVEIVQNHGNVSYRGFNIPLYHAYVQEVRSEGNGIIFIVEFSTNRLNYNGRNTGAYVYFEIFLEFNNNLSGEYVKNVPDFSRRKLRLVEFHVDPVIQGNRVVSSTYSEYDNFFASGSLIFDIYDDDFLRGNFRFIDQERFILNGNFEGFTSNNLRFKASRKISSTTQGTDRVPRSIKRD